MTYMAGKPPRVASRRRAGWALTILVFGLLPLAFGACERKQRLADVFPEPVGSDASCASDGMLLANHPGPKGQIVLVDGTRQFYCDVREVFETLIDPEQRHRVAKVFVQPVDDHGWAHHPDGWAETNELHYVLGSRKMGHMGPTIVPFKTRAAAEAFMAEQGGRLLAAVELTEPVVTAYMEEVRAALREMRLAPGHAMGGEGQGAGKHQDDMPHRDVNMNKGRTH